MEVSLKILFESLLNEGRTKSIIDKWSNYVVPGHEDRGPLKNEDDWSHVIKTVQERDPSGTGKYLDYILSQIVSTWVDDLNGGYDDISSIDSPTTFILNLVDSFHKFSERNLIQNKDIYSPEYKDITVLRGAINQATNKHVEIAKEKELKGSADKIYQDSRWVVMVPKTHEASCHYGAGTKWCTTAKGQPSYFTQYTSINGGNGVLFYILDKTRKSGTLYKLAIHQTYAPGETKREVENGVVFQYQTIKPISGSMTGYDEEDQPVNLKYILPLLPQGLLDAIQNYYQSNVDRVNNKRREEAMRLAVVNRERQRVNEDVYWVRYKQIHDAFLRAIKQDNWIFNQIEAGWESNTVINNSFTGIYGQWDYTVMDNGHRFQIYHAGEYPNRRVEEQIGYFIDGQLLFDEENLAVIRLYKSPEDEPFGDVDSAEAVNVNLPIKINQLFSYHQDFGRLFKEGIEDAIDSLLGATYSFSYNVNNPERTIVGINPEHWNTFASPDEIVKRALQDEYIDYEEIINWTQFVIEVQLYRYFYQSNVPSKDGSVLWKANSGHSSYKFEYPASQNSLTKRFLDYVIANPGRTAEEFYRDVLGQRRRPAHNSTFFGSIKDAGLVRLERRGRQFVYFIGPNYETWTQGRLKRI